MYLSFPTGDLDRLPRPRGRVFSTSRFTRHLTASSAFVGVAGFGSSASFPSVCASIHSSSRECQRRRGASSPSRDSFHLLAGRRSHLGVVQGGVRYVRRGDAASLPARRIHSAFSQVIWIQVSVFASLVCGGPRRRRRSPSTTRSVSPSSLAPLQSAPASSLSSPTVFLGHLAASFPAVPLVRLLSRFLFFLEPFGS